METNPNYNNREMGDIEMEASSMIKDVRKYLCQYCGISRSKKYLITSHILSHHKMEIEEEGDDEACEVLEAAFNKLCCQECGAAFKKPAHLKQHMISHSLEALDPKQRTPKCEATLLWTSIRLGDLLRSSTKYASITQNFFERPFTCYVDDCAASYRRKDHLNRHILTHKGKLFKCPLENCKSEFSVQGNVSRHVKDFHINGYSAKDDTGLKQHVCKEIGCGKVFKYASQLEKHQDSHVKLDSVEALCSEPGCMKYFTNHECLKAHIRSCHQHVNCEICGSKHLKKNIKRHLRTHGKDSTPGEFKCEVEGCCSTFSKPSNLQKHVKAVHEDVRPFVCGFPDCGMRFAYKHVRDNHENSGCHVYTCGDFVETDENFTSRPRGGVKRKQVTAEMLIRKRIMPLQLDSEGLETC